MIETDVVIIGSGPVGLFAIFQCGMLGLKCETVDTLDHTGGQCIALYPEKPIYDIPACPGILAADLIAKLEEQIKPFHPRFHLNQKVVHVEKLENEEKWKVITSKGVCFKTKTILIAAGVGAFGPNRPPLDNLESFEGKSVFYYVKNREKFRDKTLVIAGGGDSAVDWALSLHDVARKIYIVHRRSKFRAHEASIQQLEGLCETSLTIEKIIPYQLSGLSGSDGQLSEVIIKSMSGETRCLKTDVLLAFFGLSMNLGPILEWGLGTEKNHIEINAFTAQTNQEGIYAIGDVATYPHKLKLIMTGFSEAAHAAHAIRQYIYPHKVFHFEHSTTKGVPENTPSHDAISINDDSKKRLSS
jgi:thioredoxin reductase (NADPH)